MGKPKGLLGGVDQATLVIRRDAEALLGEPALEALSRLHLGNARGSALEDALVQEKKQGGLV